MPMLHTSLIVKLLIKEVRGMSQYYLVPSSELYHHGVLGMKWGHRKARYGSGMNRAQRRQMKREYKQAEAQKKLNNKIQNNRREADRSIRMYGGKDAAATEVMRKATNKMHAINTVGSLATFLPGIAGVTIGMLTGNVALGMAGVLGSAISGLPAMTIMDFGNRHILNRASEKVSYIKDSKIAPDSRVENYVEKIK